MRVVALSLFLFVGAVCSPAMAQSTPLDEKQKAVLVFDIRMDMLRDSNLGQALNLEQQLGAITGGAGGPDPSKLDRIFGAVSAPEDMAAAMSIQAGQMPMEFFVRMKFKDEAAKDALMDEPKKDNGGTIERGGKIYYKAPANGGAPEGLLVYEIDATTVEAGTEAYIFRDEAAPFTDNLKSAWSKAPNEAIRISVDLEGAKGLISEAIAMAKQNAPNPMMGIYLDLVDNIKDLGLSIDLSGDNLLSIRATGVSESDAVELRDGLASLLELAKIGGQSQIGMVKQMDPAGGAVLEELLGSLKATNAGDEVSIVIPKPAQFDEAIISAVQKFAPMMGGGGGRTPTSPAIPD